MSMNFNLSTVYMGKITILTTKEIIEGAIASIIYPILIYKISRKHKEGIVDIKWTAIIPWFATWIVRKMSMHMFDYLEKNYGLENHEYKFNFYFF